MHPQDKTQSREKPGVSDGSFQGHHYFQCEDGYAMYVSLRCLSPADGDTAGTLLDRRPSYSQMTGGGPSQSTRSSDRPLYSKAASTDGSPSATSRSRAAPLHAKSAGTYTARSSESMDPPALPRFMAGQHVMFYDMNGDKHYGTVGWAGRNTRTRSFAYRVVGIKTVSVSYISLFIL